MKKKLIALFAAGALAACTLFAGCSKDTDDGPAPSETFTGSVSVQTYASVDAAAADCVAKEISGDDYKVTMTEYVKETELTETEVTNLNIGGQVQGTVESVEKGKLYFNEVPSSGVTPAAAAPAVNMYITVYIIKYTPTGSTTSEYKYMVPLPANNEVLSYSYYNSVMSPENFKNCTLTYTTTTTATTMGFTQSDSDVQKMYITESAVKMELSVQTDLYTKKSATAYLIDGNGGLKCAVEMDGECVVVTGADLGLEINSISEIYTTGLNEAQYSLFIKTGKGFKMRDDAVEGIMQAAVDALRQQFAQTGMTFNLNNLYCDYTVVEGKLYSGVASIDMTMTMPASEEVPMSMTINATSKAVVTYTDYGTTTVTISDTAKEALGIS